MGWHDLFYSSALLGALCFALILFFVPESGARAGGSFDYIGALGVCAALLCLLVPLSEGGSWVWGSAKTLGLFAAGVTVMRFMRARHPFFIDGGSGKGPR